MATKLALVPQNTTVEKEGHGEALDISASPTRTFLCTLDITDIIEQQSLDVSIWGSTDKENWGAKPILMLPQRFYRGETRMVLDLNLVPEVKFIRAGWILNRWGRVAPTPRFTIRLTLEEIPAMTGKHATRGAAVAS